MPTASWRPAAIAARSTACRSRSRICSTSAARRRPRRRACARDTSRPPTRRSIVRAAPGRRGLHRQDEPARVRVRHDERGLGVRSRPQPARSVAIARRIERRVGRERRGRHGAGDHRHRHRRIDPDSGRRLRHRRPEADVRRDLDWTASCRCRGRSITSDRLARHRHRRVAFVYHALARRAPSFALRLPAPGQRRRWRVLRGYFCDLLDDEVRARFEDALDSAARPAVRCSTTSRSGTPA